MVNAMEKNTVEKGNRQCACLRWGVAVLASVVGEGLMENVLFEWPPEEVTSAQWSSYTRHT